MHSLRSAASRVTASARATLPRVASLHSSRPRPGLSEDLIHKEESFSAHNYHPLPIVFAKAKGVSVWDPEGRHYYDFLSAYSAVNQGHCNEKILNACISQLQNVTLSSRAFHNNIFPEFAEYITNYFGYDRVLPMNTGAEAVETALKIARKWGYEKKGIPEGQAILVAAEECFHGRTIAIISLSNDPDAYNGFGPMIPGVIKVEYNNIPALEKAFEEHGKHIAGFIVEPIQGEAGVYVPDDGYLNKVAELCKKHNILFIADEVQTGIARTGKLLCVEHDGVKPDMIVLGKAISGGVYPVSAVLANEDVMSVITPGTHGSTYGGNPVACATAIAALDYVKEEGLVDHAQELGEYFRSEFRRREIPLVTQVRGRGLLNAFVIDKTAKVSAWEICVELKNRGLLCKPTHENIIRLAPPLVITKEQLDECIDIIYNCLVDMSKK